MTLRMSLLSFLVSAAGAASAARAETDEPARGGVAVDFSGTPGTEPWLPAALEGMVGGELSRFHRVELAPKLLSSRCPGRGTLCLLDGYREAGADVVVLGTANDAELAYEVYEARTGARAFRGTLGLREGTRAAVLRQRMGAIVRPIVQSGGLIDQLPSLAPAAKVVGPTPPPPAAPEVARPGAPAGVDALRLALALGILAFAWPVVLAQLLVRRRPFPRPAAWTGSAAVVAVLTLSLLGTLAPGLLSPAQEAVEALWRGGARPVLGILLSLSAGGLWAAWLLVCARWLFPPLQGLGRIRHDALWPLLRGWGVLVLSRAVLLAAYLPVAVVALGVCRGLGVEPRIALAWVLPSSLLLSYFWFLTLVDSLALYLDDRLVLGEVAASNPWHRTFKRYFMGYVRRNGVDLDRKRLERVLFLPGRLGVLSYGGGLSAPRVLVDVAARDLALGELPDEEEGPERTAFPEHLPYGLLVPASSARPKRGKGGLERTQDERRARSRLLPTRALPPRLIGQNTTLLGWVTPVTRSESVPLISNSREDFDVVRSLLTEHYGAFEKNLDEDEHDDTDPTQKDFLFGALLREVGAIARHDSRFATVRLAMELGAYRASWALRPLTRFFLAIWARLFVRPATAVADCAVALNRGLDPLLQYLHLLAGGSPEWCTARASAPRLAATSKRIIDATRPTDSTAPDQEPFRARARERIERLAEYFYAPIAPQTGRTARRLLGVGAFLGFALLFARAAVAAIDYHPVFEERMREMKQRADNAEGGPDGGQSR